MFVKINVLTKLDIGGNDIKAENKLTLVHSVDMLCATIFSLSVLIHMADFCQR